MSIEPYQPEEQGGGIQDTLSIFSWKHFINYQIEWKYCEFSYNLTGNILAKIFLLDVVIFDDMIISKYQYRQI